MVGIKKRKTSTQERETMNRRVRASPFQASPLTSIITIAVEDAISPPLSPLSTSRFDAKTQAPLLYGKLSKTTFYRKKEKKDR